MKIIEHKGVLLEETEHNQYHNGACQCYKDCDCYKLRGTISYTSYHYRIIGTKDKTKSTPDTAIQSFYQRRTDGIIVAMVDRPRKITNKEKLATGWIFQKL